MICFDRRHAAAEAGDVQAQFQLAQRYRQGQKPMKRELCFYVLFVLPLQRSGEENCLECVLCLFGGDLLSIYVVGATTMYWNAAVARTLGMPNTSAVDSSQARQSAQFERNFEVQTIPLEERLFLYLLVSAQRHCSCCVLRFSRVSACICWFLTVCLVLVSRLTNAAVDPTRFP